MVEASRPNEDILVINGGTKIGIGLRDLGNGDRSVRIGLRIWSGAWWTIYCHRGIRD
jgi:hypothetical protein